MSRFQPIQFVLAATIVLLLVFYFKSLRSVLWDRLVVLILFAVGFYSVIFPDHVTRVANLFGVIRGTDFSLYLFIILSLFVWLVLQNRIKSQNQKITKLARSIAVDSAQKFER